MSSHAYSRCWLHVIWATLSRERTLDRQARARLAPFLDDYTKAKGIYVRARFVNADHVHMLVDLPTNLTIENLAKLLKGTSSHWINEQQLCVGHFAWQRGYGAFSISHSGVPDVQTYIANQEQHHARSTFSQEYRRLVELYGLSWRDEDTGKVISGPEGQTVENALPEDLEPFPPR